MPGGEDRVDLVDKSALEQRRHNEDARNLLELLLGQGALATCHVSVLEVLYSARTSLTTRLFGPTSLHFRGFR